MDVLIDLIIYIIKQMTKPRAPGAGPPSSQQRARQAALARQAQAVSRMTAPRAPQRGRAARPGVRTPPTAWTQVAAIKPAQLVRPMAAPPVAKPVAPVVAIGRSAPPRIGAAVAMRIPILLGQVLEPPIALQDDEV